MEQDIARARHLTELLDSRFHLGPFHFGLDPLIGFIPVAGDAAGLILSLYIIWIAARLRVDEDTIAQMLQNSFLDFLLGLIPVLGDVGDFLYKSNSKNLALLEKSLHVSKANS